MSAEVPKLHRRLPLGDPGFFGTERPPTEVLVVLADPAVLSPPPVVPIKDGEPDYASMTFPALSRFDYV